MNLNKFFLLSSVALMAVACQDKKEAEFTPANPGDEVDFGAALEDNGVSRTIYGPENPDEHYFPINWYLGDQVFVASPDCNPGRSTGTYQVPNEAHNQNYAGSLNKVGQTGVQWGDKETADFYSVYPQRTGDFEVTTTTGSSFNLNMPSVQTCLVEGTGSSLKMTTADMYACFMWARTPNVQRGQTVNLRYKPLSTAIRFKLKGNANIPVTVTQIRLYGPTGTALSGKFSVDLSSGEAIVTPSTTAGETSNMVTVFARDNNQNYLILNPGETIELNAFIIPQEAQINQNWSIEVVLSTGNTLTKKLTPNESATITGTTLKPGMIHRLPDLPNLVPGKMDPSKWMTYIPRNVYLSEISIPGSWNSLNEDFQTELNLSNQYSKGVRLFHLDTRYRCNSPLTTLVSTDTRYTLGVANGQLAADIASFSQNGKVMLSTQCEFFSTYLSQIVGQVKDDEYLVLMCTFAQDSFVPVKEFDWTYARSPKRSWMEDVSEACNNSTITSKIFDARNLTPNTTVGDALGKVIVIINCESPVSGLTLPDNSKCLFTYMPMKRESGMYTSGFGSDKMYNRKVNTTTSQTTTNETGITFDNTQAQITSNTTTGIQTTTSTNRGYAPTMDQRKTIGQNILTFAEGTYTSGSYEHNVWYYQGLGGYQISDNTATVVDGSYATLAQDLNLWLNGKILNMKANPSQGNSRFFPVGLILMNFVTNETYGTPVVYNILQLNYQFHKQFDPSKPAWPVSTQMSAGGTTVPDSGDAI
ncbi:MAG: hypothetical protein HUJ99_01220 [Bacteroidaceae bacterium]|nr:hypothetical protein [Bacteroidaceae bacterium]